MIQRKDLPALGLGVLDSRVNELGVRRHLGGGKATGIWYISKCFSLNRPSHRPARKRTGMRMESNIHEGRVGGGILRLKLVDGSEVTSVGDNGSARAVRNEDTNV